MNNQYTYWQNSSTPFFIIRQTSFTTFECFDRKTKTWREYSDGFREVSLNHECHEIPGEEANRIVSLLTDRDTATMDYKALCDLVNYQAKNVSKEVK